jgi:hypothetical protein
MAVKRPSLPGSNDNQRSQYARLHPEAMAMKKYQGTKGLAALCMAALPLALAGCFHSSSSDSTTTVTGSVAFMEGWMDGLPQITWGPEVTVTAFAPAQRSWQWMVSADHAGAGFVNGGTGCVNCHSDAGFAPSPAELGAALVGADEDPIPGKRGFVDITVQAAYDAEKFYLRAAWQTKRPGVTHDIWTYQGGDWVRNSHERPEELGTDEVYSREDRIGVMFAPVSNVIPAADGHPNNFNNVGCWVTCHSDMHDMPDMDEAGYTLGDEITKYLKISRVGGGGANDAVDDTAIAAYMNAGTFPDMWHFRGGRGAAVQTLTDGYVMSTRSSDSGAHPYATNSPAPGNYMYDIDVMGFHALPGDEWADNMDNAPPLIVGVNAVEFDGTVEFNEGDILPRRRLTVPGEPRDSRNDVTAYSSWKDGVWTVIMVRDRDTGHAQDHVLNPASVNYTFAFSIFEDHSGGRWHHVTFPVNLGTTGSGAIIQAAAN